MNQNSSWFNVSSIGIYVSFNVIEIILPGNFSSADELFFISPDIGIRNPEVDKPIIFANGSFAGFNLIHLLIMRFKNCIDATSISRIDAALLFFRVAVSAELFLAHGLKKIGIGVEEAESIPNPFDLPTLLNDSSAIAANIVCPVLISLGLFTRMAVLPIIAVTLTGYFVVHFNDPLAVKDVPFMYSVCFIFLLVSGAGKYSLDTVVAGKS